MRGDDVLINSIGENLSQCLCTSNQHVVHFKYLKILFVIYTSIKLKKGKSKEKNKYLKQPNIALQ